MRYRQLSASGDYQIGAPFLYNVPAAVGQSVLTRLKLWQGEWFLDTAEGTPYLQKILGARGNVDGYLKQRILGTTGVSAIVSYSSQLNRATRALSVTATIQTLYGTAQVSTVL